MDTDIKSPEKLYDLFLNLYPEEYKDRYSEDLKQVFNDLYKDNKQNKMLFWIRIIFDTLTTATTEHILFIEKKGLYTHMKNIINLNKYNITGVILLLPFLTIAVVDFVSRVIQRDLSHPNLYLYNDLDHTFLYSPIILGIWILIFPVCALIINMVPILLRLKVQGKYVISKAFIQENLISICIVGLGFFALMVIAFHDFAPCMLNNIMGNGLGNVGTYIQLCKTK